MLFSSTLFRPDLKMVPGVSWILCSNPNTFCNVGDLDWQIPVTKGCCKKHMLFHIFSSLFPILLSRDITKRKYKTAPFMAIKRQNMYHSGVKLTCLVSFIFIFHSALGWWGVFITRNPNLSSQMFVKLLPPQNQHHIH